MLVPAKTLLAQRHVRSLTTFTRYNEFWHLRHYRCLEACEGLFAIWELDGAYNTVGINIGAYNTVCVRAVVEHCSRMCSGYGPVSWF